MKDPQGKGVNVTRTAGATKINGASGVYHIRYEISFDGQHLRGDVPELYVASASGFALSDQSGATFLSGGTALTSYEYKIWGNAEGYGAGDSHTYVGALNADCNPGSESCSYVTAIEGNQPAGTFVLAYECEGRTQDVISATVTQNSKKALVELHKNWTVHEGDYLRVANAYYQVDTVQYSKQVAGNVTLTLDTAFASTSGTYKDAEIGYFYSDPDATSGVSTYCLANRITRSSTISVDSTASTLSSAIRAIDTVESASTSLTVVRYMHNVTSRRVGYYWDVTFNEQPGDLKPMKCVADGYYYKTNAYDGEKFCNVTTIQDGSLLDGYFMLGTTYPHEYIHYPRNYNSSYIRRDIEADTLATLLQRVTVKCNESNSGSYHGASPYVDHQVAGQQGMDAIYYWDDCPSYEGTRSGVSSPSSGTRTLRRPMIAGRVATRGQLRSRHAREMFRRCHRRVIFRS